MNRAYLNHDDRATVLKLIGFIAVFEEAERRKHLPSLFGKYWADLKRAKSFLLRALEGLSTNIGQEQAKKIVNMSKTHDLALVGRAAPHDDSTVTLTFEQLYDIVELAIWNHCTGCTLEDYRSCRLFQVLDAVDVPPADTKVTNDCPYRQ